ncbi:hypothetical protein B1R32_104199 [Abditibacterium utsteinense]|uniref:DUF429 domain-containing protein n=2 Tax=Abditibacterium utsteinense TaxID=1960156 RepID=A0A2S8SV81_9BACT|nr:hypothetical protein B1R32_104199 [Abditibacterium utsteinense]
MEAGQKIWVSRAQFDGEKLSFDFLERAADLPGGNSSRDAALCALRDWIVRHEGAACGLDFPFALQQEALGEEDYATWLRNFPRRYADSQKMKESGFEARRACELVAKVPFSPLNLRLYRQTYHGIAEVLAPLRECGARVLPFDAPIPQKIWLLEICPASLLKREKLYLSYKGKSDLQRQNREIIAREMATRTPFAWSEKMEKRALEDTEGDALDAVLAAICTFNALRKPETLAAQNELEKREGRVYF